jgi:hypothetical protein
MPQTLQQVEGQFLFNVGPIVFGETSFADQLSSFVANEFVSVAIKISIRIL